jgi:hypothetical protein
MIADLGFEFDQPAAIGFELFPQSTQQHAGSNCQNTWLDFRVASKRYNSTSNLASRAELFGIGGQQRRGLNGSLNS